VLLELALSGRWAVVLSGQGFVVRVRTSRLELGRLEPRRGGILDRDATAFVRRAPLHSMQYLAYWGSPVHQQLSLAWLRGLHDSMHPYVTGGAHVNYADPDLKLWQRAHYGSNYPRLVAVKRRYDPDRLFRFPQANSCPAWDQLRRCWWNDPARSR
jgi:hypothetical protein